jgi:tRNA(Ser,Leu) C12 N-acetylase TAN1
MFANDPKSMRETLREMARSAHNETLGQGIEPTEKLRAYIEADGRFKGFASDRLAAETMERVRNGNSQSIDLDDPYLHGGQQRPLRTKTGSY